MVKQNKGKQNSVSKYIKNALQTIHSNVTMLNGSKIFAGFMIIMLNISSRFVTIKLSKSMEAYLKYTFSRQILIFTIAWMGTRDIYIALTVAVVFTIIMDVLFNEDSSYCVLPVSFTEYHTQISEEQEDNDITQNIPGMPPTQNNNNKSVTKSESSSKTDNLIGEEEVKKATEVLKKAKEQNTFKERDDFYSNYYTSQM
tara:strand:+ start:210 stop:806 length:597 start_codon:yes stop_codon:yes gene_type:complete